MGEEGQDAAADRHSATFTALYYVACVVATAFPSLPGFSEEVSSSHRCRPVAAGFSLFPL